MMVSYYSFLLRLWLASDTEHPHWRVSLENPHTREVVGFDNLDALVDCLRKLTAEANGGKQPWRSLPDSLSEKSADKSE